MRATVTPLEELIPDPWFPVRGRRRGQGAAAARWSPSRRAGMTAGDCSDCARGRRHVRLDDEHWRLTALPADRALGPGPARDPRPPRLVRGHAADDLLAELGPLTARIERAIRRLGGIARVHVPRYGDGGEHFHLWFLPRPLGALQLRGSMLPVWMDVLPSSAGRRVEAALARIAAAMRAGD